MTLSRRKLLLGSACGAAAAFAGKAPALAKGDQQVLRVVPISNLSSIDPVISTAQPVRNHGYQVYDTLFGMDTNFDVKPQMAESFEVSSDRKTWTIKLRPGLKFHDGEAVLAKDCVASIRRWGQRDSLGQTLLQQTDELSSLDDGRLQFRLKSPFSLVAHALGKIGGPGPFIMPERIAKADVSTPIREVVGSGPYRFVADEWNPGNLAVYAKFDGYVPRNELANGTTGGKMVYVDRLEWRIIADGATATAAVQRGEVDWYQSPDLTLLPLLKQDPAINLAPFDDLGYITVIRFNQLQPPFNNIKMRKAVQVAVSQVDYLAAEVGDASLYQECKSMFFCGTASSTGVGSEALAANFDRAKELVKAAGYGGEKIVIISPTDLVWLHNASLVTADLLKRLGMNVDLQAMDLGTFYTRRTSVEAVDKGGWSIFHAGFSSTDMLDPSVHIGLRANGRDAWPGWPTDQDIEDMRTEWLNAPNAELRLAIAQKIELHAFQTVPFVPLGRFQTPSAMRKNVTGMLKGPLPIAWNIKKE
jgi:peptide/nickel transport system substrate-binding protein